MSMGNTRNACTTWNDWVTVTKQSYRQGFYLNKICEEAHWAWIIYLYSAHTKKKKSKNWNCHVEWQCNSLDHQSIFFIVRPSTPLPSVQKSSCYSRAIPLIYQWCFRLLWMSSSIFPDWRSNHTSLFFPCMAHDPFLGFHLQFWPFPY